MNATDNNNDTRNGEGAMNGTEKQAKWATDIRDAVAAELPDMSSAPVADKAKQYLLSIDSAEYWIDHKTIDGMGMLRLLIGAGLNIDGKRVRMDQATGEITVS